MEDIKAKYIKAYEEHADALFRYASFNVSERETAKDIVAETFTKTWTYIAKGGEIDNMKAFLYRTIKNLIIDHYRSKKSVSLDMLSEDEHFDPASEPEVTIEESSEGKMAWGLLDQIPAEYKEVVVLRYMQGLSFREIAHIMDEQENTVAVRYHRAIKKVKELFNRKTQYEQ